MSEVASDVDTAASVVADAVTALPAVKDLPETFEDDSKLTDREAAAELFAGFRKLASDWNKGVVLTTGATAAVCKLTYDLRALCLRPDGKIDWAGEYQAYKSLYENRINPILAKFMPTDRIKNFRAAVRRYDADNDYRRVYIARKLAETVPELKTDPETIIPGVKLSGDMAKALREVAESQTVRSGSDGAVKFARAFEHPENFASTDEQIGVKKARAPKAPSTVGTVSAAWDQLRAEVAKKNEDGTPHLAVLTLTEELHRLTSALAIATVGTEGKIPQVKDWAKVRGSIQASIDTLSAIIAVKDGLKKREEILAPALWSE